MPLVGGTDGFGAWGACDPAEPRNRRSRSSIIIEGPSGKRLLVDAGPDLRAQFLTHGVGRIDELLFTHAHADHVMGVDELRSVNRVLGTAIPAYGTAATLQDVARRFDYAFRPAAPPGFFRPALEAREVAPETVVTLAGLPVRLFRQDHQVMETLGLRIGGFAYSTDVIRLPEASMAQLEGLECWVVGCFQRGPHWVHADIATVTAWVERLRPRRTILTHMGPDMDWAWLRDNLPPGIEAGHDGLRITL
ncbi:phosphoribosyl 1,2-cyclic phosphate phosphodiesterase [Humitalea rosea]|uniref:Phosphoribosyl 1,2-cyclic phosphate phosphodiesterase n=1 Tax=Humitalea rosea TaxID=990373 RepID=A0A2W7ITE7_9PROT|nr:MBL fold metallo-hydrolase [Humitalea rosea]PZW51071.1 phosphoribosyl 1,2-cyclic phosphate phosphodiesterase [Humitalea rosea]